MRTKARARWASWGPVSFMSANQRTSVDSLEVPTAEERLSHQSDAAVTRRAWRMPLGAPPLGPGALAAHPAHPALVQLLVQQPQAVQHMEEVYNIHVISLFSSIVLTLSVLLAVVSIYYRFGGSGVFTELDSELRFVLGAFAAQLMCSIGEILAWLLDRHVPVLSVCAACTHISSWVCYIALLILVAKVTHLSVLSELSAMALR